MTVFEKKLALRKEKMLKRKMKGVIFAILILIVVIANAYPIILSSSSITLLYSKMDGMGNLKDSQEILRTYETPEIAMKHYKKITRVRIPYITFISDQLLKEVIVENYSSTPYCNGAGATIRVDLPYGGSDMYLIEVIYEDGHCEYTALKIGY